MTVTIPRDAYIAYLALEEAAWRALVALPDGHARDEIRRALAAVEAAQGG